MSQKDDVIVAKQRHLRRVLGRSFRFTMNFLE